MLITMDKHYLSVDFKPQPKILFGVGLKFCSLLSLTVIVYYWFNSAIKTCKDATLICPQLIAIF